MAAVVAATDGLMFRRHLLLPRRSFFWCSSFQKGVYGSGLFFGRVDLNSKTSGEFSVII